MKSTAMPIAAIVAGGFLLLIAPGCGGSSASSAGSGEARQTLDRALSAWREGKTLDSLKTTDPPLEAADHQWQSGLHLVKYEVENDRAPSGPSQSFRVTLWLKDARSKATKVVTQYDVATNPARVSRAGF
jgi:hypothetical protein